MVFLLLHKNEAQPRSNVNNKNTIIYYEWIGYNSDEDKGL